MPHEPEQFEAERAALRRRQIAGLLLLALLVLAFTVWRARHGLFPPGWWRIW